MSENDTEPMNDREQSREGISRFVSRKLVLGAGALVVLALLPFASSPILLLKLSGALYFAIFAMSWDMVSGYTGELSFGHSFLFAIGGYTAAIMTLDFGLPPIVSIVIGGVAAVLGGLVIGAPALRLKGPYFAIVTFLLPTVLNDIFVLYKDVFGGELGLPSPSYLVDAGGQVQTIIANYYLALVLFAAAFALLYYITRSNTGEILTAIRESEDAVSAVGINPAKFKIYAFLLSAGVGGIAAAVFVHTPVGNPNPTQLLAVAVSVNVLLATILGGTGTITGPAIGGIIFYLLQDFISNIKTPIPGTGGTVGDFNFVIFLVIILYFIYYLPDGLLGLADRFTNDASPIASDGGQTPLEQIVNRYTAWFKDFGRNE